MREWLAIAGFVLLLTGWSALQVHWARTEAPPPADLPAVEAVVAAPPADTVAAGNIRLTPHSMRIASSARHFVDTRPPRRYRDDCSGFVSAILTRAGVPMDGVVASIWESARVNGALHHNPIPRIGDLAFFDNTHDRNHNGVWDDQRTHIAVVVDVDPDGTIVLAHNGSDRRLIRMNLLEPHLHETEAGEPRNSWLRRHGYSDEVKLQLTGQLWSGFATVNDPDAWLDDE
ncbi:MAG: hypothetical protein ACI8PZ_002066 [Myxococcota bacterium]|jgi:hypothetical protein